MEIEEIYLYKSSSLENLYLEEFIKLKLNKITKTVEHQILDGYLIRKSCIYKEEKILLEPYDYLVM
jgi:hypothetical protein